MMFVNCRFFTKCIGNFQLDFYDNNLFLSKLEFVCVIDMDVERWTHIYPYRRVGDKVRND